MISRHDDDCNDMVVKSKLRKLLSSFNGGLFAGDPCSRASSNLDDSIVSVIGWNDYPSIFVKSPLNYVTVLVRHSAGYSETL